MAWVSPTGFVDALGKWTSETNVYDEDTGTYALNPAANRGNYLELTLDSAIECDKVRICARDQWIVGYWYDPDLAIDVYYDGAYHNIFSGVITKETWVEKEIPAGRKTVEKAQVKANTDTHDFHLLEFDLWEVEITVHEKEITEGIAVGEVLIKQPGKMVSEGVFLGEVLVKSISKAPFVEGIALGEVLETVRTKIKEIIEGIVVGEVLEKQVHKIISEGIVIGEVLKKAITKSPIVEGLAIGEVLIKSTSRIIIEGIAIGEVVSKGISKIVTEGIAIGEELFKMWVHPAIRTLRPLRVLDAIRNLLKEREL